MHTCRSQCTRSTPTKAGSSNSSKRPPACCRARSMSVRRRSVVMYSFPFMVYSKSSPRNPSCFSLFTSSTTLRSDNRTDDFFCCVACSAFINASKSIVAA